ncbi:MAG: hypothetical protein IJ774_09985 [Selenomonadaceae bacterium]|nr:hypothetical protein [Selenomonadaceae bacterium]
MDDLILAIEDAEAAQDEADEIKDAILRLVDNPTAVGALLEAFGKKVAECEELWQVAEQNPEFNKRYRDRLDAHGKFLMATVEKEMKDFDEEMPQK